MPEITNPTLFSEEFANIYLGRGFGSMNKNDLEVLIFHLLNKYGNINGKSNFQLARELKLPETKIKRLAYEAELSYGSDNKAEQRARFLELLGKAKIQKENGTLRFVVEDRYLRSTIYEDLKQMGLFFDSSFNSEIVSIQKDALIAILDLYYDDEQKADMLKAFKDARKRAKKDDCGGLDFKGMMSLVVDKLLDKGIDAVMEGAKKIDYASLVKTVSLGYKAIKSVISIIVAIATVG